MVYLVDLLVSGLCGQHNDSKSEKWVAVIRGASGEGAGLEAFEDLLHFSAFFMLIILHIVRNKRSQSGEPLQSVVHEEETF